MSSVVTGLGQTLSALRKARKWSQEKLALKARLSNMTISRIERNRIQPHRRTWEKIALALGMTVDELLTADHRSASDAGPDELRPQLLTLWRALPPEHRQAGIDALGVVAARSAEVRQLRIVVAELERQVRLLEREVRELRDQAASGRTAGHRQRAS